MPPPRSRNVAQSKPIAFKKEQIAEKVREIQQRQKNWLKQRDQHIKSDSTETHNHTLTVKRLAAKPCTPDKYATNGRTKHKPDILKVHHKDSTHLFTAEVSDKLNVKVTNGFGAWLKSRKDERETGDEDYHQTSHYEGEASSLKMSAASQLLQPEVSCSSSNRNYPLSPEEFDTLADSIASKVKQDLGIANEGGGQSHNGIHMKQDDGHFDEKSEGISRGRTFVQNNSIEKRDILHGGNGEGVDVSSHCCPFCSVLMATTKHVPMLLVPCGHTVCKHCATSHSSCRLCGTLVVSLTTNIMLQQIIHEFHRKNHKNIPTIKSQQNTTHASLVNRRREESPSKTTAIYTNVNYSIQLQSLMDRKQTMQDEVTSCSREADRITSKVQRAEKQLGAIEREEQGLVEQIQRLEEKLLELQHHKDAYATEYQQLKEEERTALQQVELVKSTLKSLGDEIDKVREKSE